MIRIDYSIKKRVPTQLIFTCSIDCIKVQDFFYKIFFEVVFQKHGGRLSKTWCRDFFAKLYKFDGGLWYTAPIYLIISMT